MDHVIKTEHMTLGELRDAIAKAPDSHRVYYDQFGLAWKGFHSWRGIYALPAIGWTDTRGGVAGELLALIDRALAGEVYTGWKGGEYSYSRRDPVWVDRPGESSSTALVGVTVTEYSVTLHTAHREVH